MTVGSHQDGWRHLNHKVQKHPLIATEKHGEKCSYSIYLALISKEWKARFLKLISKSQKLSMDVVEIQSNAIVREKTDKNQSYRPSCLSYSEQNHTYHIANEAFYHRQRYQGKKTQLFNV